MSHLSAERLAALVDEPPTAEELAHLAGCAECARERRAYEGLGAIASAEAARIGAPLTEWEDLAPALRADGVIDTGRHAVWRRRTARPWLQVAAALLLVAGGMGLERLVDGRPFLPGFGAERVAQARPDSSANTAAAPETPRFRTLADARAARDTAAALYQAAVSFIAAQDTSGATSPSAMRTRLAALDQVGQTMREALREAPSDPVINGYYLTTMGQREATIRQINTQLPQSVRINSF